MHFPAPPLPPPRSRNLPLKGLRFGLERRRKAGRLLCNPACHPSGLTYNSVLRVNNCAGAFGNHYVACLFLLLSMAHDFRLMQNPYNVSCFACDSSLRTQLP